MRNILLSLFLLNVNIALAYNQGDILFQTSKSAQSKYIMAATGSRYTHCGVIYRKDGEDYVLEAVDKVKLTPVDEWIARGEGRHVAVRRCPKKDFEIDLAKYAGKPYDLSFSWTDARMYCSESVYKVYADNGIILCELRKVSDYNVGGFEAYLKERGISLSENVVAPSDLLERNGSDFYGLICRVKAAVRNALRRWK